MNPQPGQLVQIRFNNGIFFDAIVQEWSDQKSSVKLPDTNEVVIIQKTLQDVLVVKILKSATQEPKHQESGIIEEYYEEPIVDANEVVEEFHSLKEQPMTPDNLKKIIELKSEMNKLDREETFKKLRTFEATGARSVQYGLPPNIKVSSATQYTDEEIASTDTGFHSELQRLFSKED